MDKDLVAQAALDEVRDGMVLGIGSGTTSAKFIQHLAKKVKDEALQLTLVSTSEDSTALAERLGLKVSPLNEIEHIDLTIDGVDEFTDDFYGIKGGGGKLLMEKVVASRSDESLWMAEERKHVQTLGAFPLAVEVIKDGSAQLVRRWEKQGFSPTFRLNEDGSRHLTDNQNYIVDLHCGKIEDPRALGEELIHLVGVVEHGLFLDYAKTILIADNGIVRKIQK